MYRRIWCIILVICVVSIAAGCGDGSPPKLDYKNFDGGIFDGQGDDRGNYWIMVGNQSNYDLDDVNVVVTFFTRGSKPETVKIEQHWDQWKKGEWKKVMTRFIEGSEPYQFQKAIGEGTSKRFLIRFAVAEKSEF